MILVDTSAWVEFDRATGSEVDHRLTELIESAAEIAVTEPITMEVCAGARSDSQQRTLSRMLAHFTLAAFDPVADFDAATQIYRRCRRGGVTPRGLIDCMIAAVARRHDAQILAFDRDFARLAAQVNVTLHPDSLQ